MPAKNKGASPSKGTRMLFWTMIGSILLSVLGITYAVRWGVAADGGRGGGLAVALTFFMLFMGRGTAESALEANLPVDETLTGEARKTAETEAELSRVRNAVASMLDWSRQEKVYLTISSVVGTLAWTVGDVVAKFCGAAIS